MTYQDHIKPLVDRLLALGMLGVIWPLMVIIYCFIKSKGYRQPLFVQKRTGKHKAIFKLYKFRTFPSEKGASLPHWAKFLRKYSLDEIPQLINVVKGEMSLIGPRPLLVEYIPFYTRYQDVRHSVKPGITGWAQINGRNHLSWDQKFQKDRWYVNHVSFWVDFKILVFTIRESLKPGNVYEEGLPLEAKFSHIVLKPEVYATL